MEQVVFESAKTSSVLKEIIGKWRSCQENIAKIELNKEENPNIVLHRLPF
jgi:hypothetical protein